MNLLIILKNLFSKVNKLTFFILHRLYLRAVWRLKSAK